MGNFGKIEDKFKAQKLRRQDLSYREILRTIFVSKSTMSMWCKDIQLTEGQKIRLLSKKQFGQRKGSLVAAANKAKILWSLPRNENSGTETISEEYKRGLKNNTKVN